MLAEIARGLGVDPSSDPAGEAPTLTAEQLKKLSDGGIEIGSHTVTHPALSSLGRAEAIEELTASNGTWTGGVRDGVVSPGDAAPSAAPSRATRTRAR